MWTGTCSRSSAGPVASPFTPRSGGQDDGRPANRGDHTARRVFRLGRRGGVQRAVATRPRRSGGLRGRAAPRRWYPGKTWKGGSGATVSGSRGRATPPPAAPRGPFRPRDQQRPERVAADVRETRCARGPGVSLDVGRAGAARSLAPRGSMDHGTCHRLVRSVVGGREARGGREPTGGSGGEVILRTLGSVHSQRSRHLLVLSGGSDRLPEGTRTSP